MNTKEFKTYADKEEFVQGVFSNIAKNYDLMNTVLSFGQDYYWRKFSVKAMNIGPNQRILDVACGNVPDIKQVLSEMQRVVKPGGKVVVLELAKPSMFGFKQLYNFYFSYILPIIGKLSKDNSSYAWLPESLRRYPHQSEILEIWKSLGYENATYHELTGGIVAVHEGVVPENSIVNNK